MRPSNRSAGSSRTSCCCRWTPRTARSAPWRGSPRAYPRGPRSYRAAAEHLERRGLLAGRRTATPAAHLEARRARVRAIVERPAAPAGRDAELPAFMAALQLLPVERRAQHLQARLRPASIADPPAAVRELVDEFAVSTMQEFTDKVLPPLVDPVVGDPDPGWSSGIGTFTT